MLNDIDLRDYDIDPIIVLDDVLHQMDLMFNVANMVHGDFSEHNIIWYRESPYIIDVLQAQIWHPRYQTVRRIKKRDSLIILKKDIHNILTHFKNKYRVSYDPEEVFRRMPDEKVDDWEPEELLDDNTDLENKKGFF